MRYLALALVVSACGSCGTKAKPNPSEKMLAEVSAQVAKLEPFAPLCQGYISKANCDQGDATLFAGLLCLSGNKVGCDTVKHSISDNGKVWRSPKAVNNDTPNSSSRDMFLGAMAYFVATKDTDGLERVSWYLKSTGKICEDATDGRCNITPNIRDVLDQVRAFNSLATTQSRKGYSEVLAFEANSAPEGYAMHLTAVELLILKSTGTWNKTLQFAADTLARRQGDNPFFEVLAHGKTQHYAELMLAQLPKATPDFMNQWSFERRTSEAAWSNSMLWEFIFVEGLNFK